MTTHGVLNVSGNVASRELVKLWLGEMVEC